jgi:hypothetical protein
VARVPNTDSLEHIIGPSITVKVTAPIEEQRKFLAEFDRQIAVIEAKKLNKNGNYEE